MHGNSLCKGVGLWLADYRNSVAKVIANRALCAPATGKRLTCFFNTLRRVQHPCA
ncbi:hypothetical protein [Pseudomonas fluorescens]|nr:hypothetical protein [Pseudomonas fluorescens]